MSAYCRVCLTIKLEEYVIVYCWKQGRLSNIFETEITYFSQFFHIHG
jgi:hypothetical protein